MNDVSPTRTPSLSAPETAFLASNVALALCKRRRDACDARSLDDGYRLLKRLARANTNTAEGQSRYSDLVAFGFAATTSELSKIPMQDLSGEIDSLADDLKAATQNDLPSESLSRLARFFLELAQNALSPQTRIQEPEKVRS